MEIRNVVNEVKNEYPKIEQVSKKHLSNSIPKKWLKVGLSSLGITMILKNNVFASSPTDLPDSMEFTEMMDIAGGISEFVPIPLPIKICNFSCPIVQILSAIIFIVTGLSILITKIKSKKQPEPEKVKKWVKVLFIISIILFILSTLAMFIINKIWY